MSSERPTLEEAGAHFIHFFGELSEQGVRERIHDTFASNVHFNDTLKDVHGIDDLEPYLIESAQAVELCTVELQDVASSGGDYYLRWTMDIRFKRFKKGETTRSIGMSRLRFDESGKIVFHQDYWDAASGLFEHVPLLGGVIRRIKNRL